MTYKNIELYICRNKKQNDYKQNKEFLTATDKKMIQN